MNYTPNGPMEIALTQAGIQTPGTTTKNTGKILLIGVLALIAGGTVVYFVMNGKNKNTAATTESNEA
jgi:flagellar basal body-associated protein FliL